MKEIVVAIVLLAISIASFFMSARSFMEKGFLFNNAYIYASKQEREKMNKKPHYRQSAIVFSFLGLIFLLNAIALLLELNWIFYMVAALVVVTFIYAIVSSIALDKKR